MPALKRAATPPGPASAPEYAGPEYAGHGLEAFQELGVASLAPWTLAAPSCVLPADVGTNCTALARHFPELGLCFFETGACLAYTGADLPPALGALSVRWHLHLPLDLPWGRGPQAVAGTILALAEKVAGLAPWAYVLHPPEEPEQLSALALALAQRPGRTIRPEALLVENIRGRDLARMWPVVQELGLGVCLDLGHMLEHGQEDFLALPGLWAHTRMLHLNAPDRARPGRHAALDCLDPAGRALLGRMLAAFGPGGTVLLELFSPRELFDSLRFIQGFRAGTDMGSINMAGVNMGSTSGRKEDTA